MIDELSSGTAAFASMAKVAVATIQLALLHMPRMRSRMSMVGLAAGALAGLALAMGQVTRVKCSQMFAGMKRVRPA